jgi:hypothetical protein
MTADHSLNRLIASGIHSARYRSRLGWCRLQAERGEDAEARIPLLMNRGAARRFFVVGCPHPTGYAQT